MSDKKQKKKQDSGLHLVIPFLAVLAVLTVVSFLIPLRPTQSQMEKRNLAQFPEFTWEALADGSYFDDITTWFSDTFPGRETWLTVSSHISTLYGHSDIAIAGDLPVVETIPQIPETPETRSETPVQLETAPEESESTQPQETVWGGVNAGDDAVIEMGESAVIQIGDAAFNSVGFSQHYSDNYAKTLSSFADAMAEKGVRVISAPAPTAVGILIEKAYLEKLNCADQNAMI